MSSLHRFGPVGRNWALLPLVITVRAGRWVGECHSDREQEFVECRGQPERRPGVDPSAKQAQGLDEPLPADDDAAVPSVVGPGNGHNRAVNLP